MELDFDYVKDTEPNHLKGFVNKKLRIKEKKEDVNKEIKVLKNYMKNNKLVIGTEVTLKKVKLGLIKEVYYSKNVEEYTLKKLQHYQNISGIGLNGLNFTSTELGEKLEKPFSISLIGVIK